MIKKTTAFYVVVVGSLASFMAAYTSNAVTMALPELARVFHLSNILQNWTINLYLLTMAVLSVPFGKICAQKGLKKLFMALILATKNIIITAITMLIKISLFCILFLYSFMFGFIPFSFFSNNHFKHCFEK